MIVLDAYAVVAFLGNELAMTEVQGILWNEATELVSVNAAEVVDRMVRLFGAAPGTVGRELDLLGINLIGADAELAMAAGRLRSVHRRTRRLSLADCFAGAHGLRRAAPLATADPALAAMLRDEGGSVVGLPDRSGLRP